MGEATPTTALEQLGEAATSGSLAPVCRDHGLRPLVAFGSAVSADEGARTLGRGQPLYEAEPHLFAEEQLTAIARRADTQWLRALELDVLAGP